MDPRWSGEAKYQALLAVAQAVNSQRDLSSVLAALADAGIDPAEVDGISSDDALEQVKRRVPVPH